MAGDVTKDVGALPEGRVMKGVDRIEEITTRYEERVSVPFMTWQCSRLMRRDFNLMTAKMYKISRSPGAMMKVLNKLADIENQARLVNEYAAALKAPVAIIPTDLPLRLVSPEARSLVNALVVFDLALAKLLGAYGAKEADECSTGFFAAYGRLKHFIFKLKVDAPPQPLEIQIATAAVASLPAESVRPGLLWQLLGRLSGARRP